MSISLADELRSRSDEELAALFTARPDITAPLPSDMAALAARCNSMPSLMRARDNLNKWQFDILTVAASLIEPFSAIEVMSITSKDSKKVLDQLWSRALIYKDGAKYRIPANLRSLIGEWPAGLGPSSPKPFDMDALSQGPKDARSILERFVWGPPMGSIDVKRANKTVQWLLEHNFLIAPNDSTLFLPREVALALRGGKALQSMEQSAPEITGTIRKEKILESAAIANISTILRWCEELAHNWSDEPPTALRSGGLGVRDLKRTAEHLGVDESCAAFVAELLYIAGLVVIDTDDHILPTHNFDLWLTKSPEERWENLATLWLVTSRVAGLIGRPESKLSALGPELDRPGITTLKQSALKALNTHKNLDPDIQSLHNHLEWLFPVRANLDYLKWAVREAEWLGITGQGAISPFGRALLDGTETGVDKALPKPVEHILLQADNSAIAPGPLTLELSNMMGTIADIESRGGATVFRFSENSIRRGLDHGHTGEFIIDFLKKSSKTSVPQPLEYLINDTARKHGKLRIGQATSYIRCEDEAVISQILIDKRLDDLTIRKIAPQVLVSEVDSAHLVAALRDAGYLPALENANGILLSAPTVRRSKGRPKPPRTLVEFSEPNPGIITAAVRAIRAGEKATSHKSRDIPRTSANETLELLHQYIEDGATLTIGYADTNGGVSNRVIDPLSISLGTLLAKDHGTGEVTQFKIPRITGVARAE